MKTKKRNLFLCSALLLCTCYTASAQTDELSYLNIAHGGVEYSLTLSNLQKLTFADGKMQAFTTEGTNEFDCANLEKLYFSAVPTSINDASVIADKLKFNSASGLLSVEAKIGDIVRVYAINGKLVNSLRLNSNTGALNLNGLSKGIYLVKLNNQVIKIQK